LLKLCKIVLYRLHTQISGVISTTVFGEDIKYRYIADIMYDTKFNQYPSGTFRYTKGRTRTRLLVFCCDPCAKKAARGLNFLICKTSVQMKHTIDNITTADRLLI